MIGEFTFDRFGDAALSDKAGGGVTRRHNRIRDFLRETGSDGNVTQSCEQTIPLLRIPGRDSYRADLFYPGGIPGVTFKGTAIDVTVTNEFNSSLLRNSVRFGSAASEKGEQAKKSLLKSSLHSNGIDLIPVSFGAMGGHGKECLPYLKFLFYSRSRHQNIPLPEAAALFWTQLSLLIQRQNAEALKRLLENSSAAPSNSPDLDSRFHQTLADS